MKKSVNNLWGKKNRELSMIVNDCDEPHLNCFCAFAYSKVADAFNTILEAITHLPRSIRRVCYVQICAFMGWFPYLFYSTTWVAEVMATEQGTEPDVDDATRAGSLALLIYSCGTSIRILFCLTRRETDLSPRRDTSRHGCWNALAVLGCSGSSFTR